MIFSRLWRSFTVNFEKYGYKAVIVYAVFPVTILADILLIPLLIWFKDNTPFVLVCNSYLNCGSVALTSILLNQDLKRQLQAAQHQAELEKLHERHDSHDAAAAEQMSELTDHGNQLYEIQEILKKIEGPMQLVIDRSLRSHKKKATAS